MKIDKKLLACLPEKIQSKISEYSHINEIRIRKNAPLCFTVGNKNFISNCMTYPEDIEYCVTKLCKNSVHTYFENIKKGYIPFENGYRIGVCGTAIIDKEKIINISQINSINIRIPTDVFLIPKQFVNNISPEHNLMIYSPPNYGKTTLLKVIISKFAAPPYNKKIAVIDCKEELYSPKLHGGIPIDFYFGYPKYEAIDTAIRTMSPEIIVCDEIGLNDDISPLVNCKNCGVGLICTAHARNITELLARSNINLLHKSNVFDAYVGINFKNGTREYDYKKREDIIY